jgi:hypothetical protein
MRFLRPGGLTSPLPAGDFMERFDAPLASGVLLDPRSPGSSWVTNDELGHFTAPTGC